MRERADFRLGELPWGGNFGKTPSKPEPGSQPRPWFDPSTFPQTRKPLQPPA